MGDPTCAGCRELAQRVEALVRELLVKLAANSSNSSLPPSANPLGAPKPVKKKKSKRKRGGQPGETASPRALLVTDRAGAIG